MGNPRTIWWCGFTESACPSCLQLPGGQHLPAFLSRHHICPRETERTEWTKEHVRKEAWLGFESSPHPPPPLPQHQSATILGNLLEKKNCGKIHITYNLPFWPLLNVQFYGIKYTHIVVQPSPPSSELFISQTETLSPLNTNSLPRSSLPPSCFPSLGSRVLWYFLWCNRTVLVLWGLAYFTWHHVPQAHPCNTCQNF